MNNFKSKLISFMYGRYGIDELYYGLTVLWLAMLLLRTVTGFFLFSILGWACLIIMIWRSFSRNIARRRAENAVFLRFWDPVKAWFKLQFARVRDCRTSVYRKCPDCRAVIRLPRKRGEHSAVCPRCGKRFDVRVLF